MMPLRPKLVASDVDGTLLPHGAAELSEDVKRMITSLTNKGVIFAAISGRDIPSLRRLFEKMSDGFPLVGCDGTVTVLGGKVIYSRPLGDSAVIRALKTSLTNSIPLVLCAADRVYVSTCGNTTFLGMINDMYGDAATVITSTPEIKAPIYKLSFCTADGGHASVSSLALPGARLSYDRNCWVEYVSAIANKGTALSDLQVRYAATKSTTIAAGDSEADLPMLRKAAAVVVPETSILRDLDGLDIL